MKYYIATSSLNLDSILSAESISPASDYENHQYGSRIFEQVAHLPVDVTLLFSRIPSFSIQDETRENYPMVIEVEADAIKCPIDLVYSKDDCLVYATQSTIPLTPWNSRIIFFSRRAYNMTKIFIDGSRCNKLGDRFPITIMPSGVFSIEGIQFVPDGFTPSDSPLFDYENNVNKGFLWGYLLGQQRSFSPKGAALMKIQKRVHDIASSAISNGGHCMDNFYSELLSLDGEFRDIAEKDIIKEWQVRYESISPLLKELRVYDQARSNFYQSHGNNFRAFPPMQDNTVEVWKRYREYSDAYTSNLARRISSGTERKLLSDCVSNEGIELKCNGLRLINLILASIRNREIDKESLRVNRLATAKQIAGAIANSFGDSWADSEVRKYLGSLYNSIKNFDAFNVNSTSNEELKAIAAIILKGEDLDALMIYAEENSFADYSILMGLWGALNGYVDTSKNLLKTVLTLENINAVNTILKLDTQHEEYIDNRLVVIENRTIIKDIDAHTVTSEINSELENESDLDSTSREFESVFALVWEQCKTAIKDSSIYKALFERHGLSQEFLDAIVSDSSLNKGKGAPKGVIHIVAKQLKDKEKKQKKESVQKISKQSPSGRETSMNIMSNQPSLWDLTETSVDEKERIHFRTDYIYPLLGIVKTVNPIFSQKLIDSVFEDLKWVLDPKYVGTKTEMDLIKDFEEKLNKSKTEKISKNNKDMRWKINLYAPIDVNRTISAIKQACNL